MSETERQDVERGLLEAGETMTFPTDFVRRWLRDYADAVDHRRRMDGYAARIEAALVLADDTLLPDGSF